MTSIKMKGEFAKPPDELKIDSWWRPTGRGGMIFRRDALPVDHPEHIYNYVKREFGVDPEDYGIANPHSKRCPHCGKLLEEIGDHYA